MKLSEFILLSEQRKAQTVLHEGVLVGKRKFDNKVVFLFQLENYYVETYCDWNSRVIDEFLVFDDIKPLSPYLNDISLEGLLN